MSVLCLAEISGDQLALDATAKTVAAASLLGDVTILVCGPRAAAETAASIPNVAKVLYNEDAEYANGLAEAVADLVVSLGAGFSAIVAPATTSAKNILPRVAALLDVMIIPDVIEFVDKDTFKRPFYAGNAIQTVKSADALKVLTIRTAAFDYPEGEGSAPIEAVESTPATDLSTHISDDIDDSGGPEITSAKIVIAGGRGLGSKENFDLMDQLAAKLGAAVGASRAAVDAGYAPNDWQIGQTGKIVAPDLYIAVGISGAIQHLAGMKDSRMIVAINRDADAPIFQVADFGLVADLFEALPELTSKL